MRVPFLAACAALSLVVAPALGQARPDTFRLTTGVAAGARVSLAIGKVPRGEFAFGVRVSSDGAKRFRLTQQRTGGARFTVLRSPGAVAGGSCEGAAGSLFCGGITTPATPGGHRWTFVFTNSSSRPMSLRLTIHWRAVASAG
jgi:hypothetical protein